MLYNYLISMFFFYRWSVSNLQRHIQICGGFVATEAPNLGKILVQNLNLQQDFTKISQPAAGFCKNFPANISDKAKTRYSRMPCATVVASSSFVLVTSLLDKVPSVSLCVSLFSCKRDLRDSCFHKKFQRQQSA